MDKIAKIPPAKLALRRSWVQKLVGFFVALFAKRKDITIQLLDGQEGKEVEEQENVESAEEVLMALTEMTNIGPENRNYDILDFFEEDDNYHVSGYTMVERAVKMNANLGKEDGQYLLDNQQDIPVAFRDKVVFVFTEWRNSDYYDNVFYIYWSDRSGKWIRHWCWLGNRWLDYDRVLRRK